MPEAFTTQTFPPETLDSFRQVAKTTRHENAWNEALSTLPDPTTNDPFSALIDISAKSHAVELDEKTLEALAYEYDDLRRNSGLSVEGQDEDTTIDHIVLIDLFLEQKGLSKPANQNTLRSKAERVQRRAKALAESKSFTGKTRGIGLAALATLGVLGGGVVAIPAIRDALTQVDMSKVPEIEAKKAPEFLKLFISEANKKRLDRAKYDSEFFHRVDPELNRNRLNIVLHERGQDHNPSLIAPIEFDSITILSYNSESNKFDIITFDDIRAPEIEKQHQDKNPGTRSISRAYREGGFDLMRETLEDASGLVIDYQVSMNDQFIVDMVNDMMKGVTVNIPFRLNTSGNYINGKTILPQRLEPGPVNLKGERAVAFIKNQPTNEDFRKPEKSRDRRRILFIKAFTDQLSKGFQAKGKNIDWFFQTNAFKSALNADFDLKTYVIDNLDSTLKKQGVDPVKEAPEVGEQIFVADQDIGDGGVRHAFRLTNGDIMFPDREKSVIQDLELNVPLSGNANPNSPDLVNDYWQSLRQFLKDKLHPLGINIIFTEDK